MNRKKVLLFALATLLSVLLVACNGQEKSKEDEIKANEEATKNLTESGMPIVKDQITLDFFTGKSNVNLGIDWNDLMLWNKYRDLTNIKVNWVEQVSMDALAEKRNLALAG
ncbi:hypothetical protein J4G37_44730, partial [Microvirga sp. 3-52]|nr:hypothetical protein [Microvirga sp. 3-52]